HAGVGAGAAHVNTVAVHVDVLQALGHRERQGAAVVAGFHVGQGDETVAPFPTAAVGQRPVVAVERLLGDVTHPRRVPPQALDVVHRAQRVGEGAQIVDEGGVVVALPGDVVVQAEVLLVADLPGQGQACALAGAV